MPINDLDQVISRHPELSQRPEIQAIIKKSRSQQVEERREINSPRMHYYEFANKNRYRFQAYDVIVENSEIGEEVADVNYLPQGVAHIDEVPKSQQYRFKVESVQNMLRGFEALVKFIRENPNTRLGKIEIFHGETNEIMAKFLQKNLGIEYLKSDTEYDLYTVVFHLEELIAGIKNFRENHPRVAEMIDSKQH